MTGPQQEPVSIPSGWKVIETLILLCGALIAGGLAIWFIVFLIWGLFQSSPIVSMKSSGWEQVIGYIITIIVFLIPANGAFSCVKALKSSQARWPAIASLSAAFMGGSLMLVGYGIGWSYHPETPKMPGILISMGAGIVTALPFIVIAISRVRLIK